MGREMLRIFPNNSLVGFGIRTKIEVALFVDLGSYHDRGTEHL